MDKIVDYFILQTYLKRSKWFGRFRLSVQSNGILVENEAFQRFLRKYEDLISLAITLDGTKEKHDLMRIFPDGTGSYESAKASYLKSVDNGLIVGTKLTFAHDDLKHIKDSVVHLWELGIKDVPGNIVFEDVWEPGDETIYKEQLISLADHILDNKLWNEVNTGFFNDTIGSRSDNLMKAVCGTGGMYCVDADGSIFNCVRFMSYSLNGNDSRKYGDVYNGIDLDRVRPFKVLYTKYISDQECIDCKINEGCPYCAGNNYDESESGSLFHRSKANCEMYKVHVQANNYYWSRLYNEHSIKRVGLGVKMRRDYHMYFIISEDSLSFCDYTPSLEPKFITPENLVSGLEYAYENFYQPIFVHSNESLKWLSDLLLSKKYGLMVSQAIRKHIIRNIVPYKEGVLHHDAIYAIDAHGILPKAELDGPVILNIKSNYIDELSSVVKKVLPFTSRITINIIGIGEDFNRNTYEMQLNNMVNLLVGYLKLGIRKEIRQLTDRIPLRTMSNCFAGEKNITFGPDGNLYLCPAFYYNKDMEVNFKQASSLSHISKSPICSACDAYNCNRCVYKNLVGTGEINTPTKTQCTTAHLERKYSAILLDELKKSGLIEQDRFNIQYLDYDDPLEKLERSKKKVFGSLL